jgi:hypothetical protein
MAGLSVTADPRTSSPPRRDRVTDPVTVLERRRVRALRGGNERFRARARGRPGSSSSPVMTTTTFIVFSRPAAPSAFKAWMMMTSPPFMSITPGPVAVFGSARVNF